MMKDRHSEASQLTPSIGGKAAITHEEDHKSPVFVILLVKAVTARGCNFTLVQHTEWALIDVRPEAN